MIVRQINNQDIEIAALHILKLIIEAYSYKGCKNFIFYNDNFCVSRLTTVSSRKKFCNRINLS